VMKSNYGSTFFSITMVVLGVSGSTSLVDLITNIIYLLFYI
jgi:hypothetical protein